MSTTARISRDIRERIEIYRELKRREEGDKPTVKGTVEEALDEFLPTEYSDGYNPEAENDIEAEPNTDVGTVEEVEHDPADTTVGDTEEFQATGGEEDG